jgi:BirA family transcriptional regulator, biotin operon repressor / biotin---[acetyl-CoA-carboxylase] ligase
MGTRPVHVALCRPDRHARGSRDLLVRHPEHVAEDDHEPLARCEARECGGQLAALVREQGGARGIALVAGRLVVERKLLRLPDPLARKAIPAGVDHEAMEPGGELGLPAELPKAGAQLDEGLLRGVTGLLEVAHQLRRKPVHPRRMPFDENVECAPVTVACLADEVHVAQLPVRDRPPKRLLLLDRTDGHGGWLHGGVSLVLPMADALTAETVQPLLRGRFGRPYLFQERCESSQRLLDPGLEEGAVAVCDEQTAGRGRLGRSWSAPAGTAILCSVLLRPPAERAFAELSLVGGVAVAEAVETATHLAAQIKWPNDVLLNRRKVAGVLAETSAGAVVLGVGLNVNQSRGELPTDANVAAGSLLTTDGVRRERAPILADLLVRLERAYDLWRDGGLDAVYTGLGARDFLRGRRVYVDGEPGIGIAVDRRGRLEVEIDGERRLVESGEVLFER